jgi:hypothetical protein
MVIVLVASLLWLTSTSAYQNSWNSNKIHSRHSKIRRNIKLNDANIIIDEIARESGNFAQILGGTLELVGKTTWEVGKVAAPYIGKTLNSANEFVAPIASEKASEFINTLPSVQEKVIR